MFESHSFETRSSLSQNVIQLPLAFSNPTFLAELTPPFSLWNTRTRLSFLAYSSQISPERSVLPSSIRSNSMFLYVCHRILSMHCCRVCSELYTGTIIEINVSDISKYSIIASDLVANSARYSRPKAYFTALI